MDIQLVIELWKRNVPLDDSFLPIPGGINGGSNSYEGRMNL
jgi:hypothetical protein